MPDTRPMLYPSPERTVWTVADLDALPEDGNRYEILHGELLVTPLPSNGHQGVAGRLFTRLAVWCQANTGWACRTPGGVYISETTWLEPDIAIYPAPEYSALPWREMPPPLLVVEVASPSTRRRDRHRKRPAFLTHGVQEVWIVDEERRAIERWTSASEFPATHHDSITWEPVSAADAAALLVVTAEELFGPELDAV
ncbi:MAG TPA: Uma2 family endonuclease [Gemmatimonas sp.]|nr:Uma2 family endonuclease [Gemmatimonas sp.]